MRGFILLWLAVATHANQLGYDYTESGQVIAAGIGSGNGISGIGSASNGGSNTASTVLASRFAGFNNGADVAYSQNDAAVPATVSFNKEYYMYAAPEEDANDYAVMQNIARSLHRNLRVIFIKAPEQQGLTNAALQLAKQAGDQRTAIYVLSKQADIGDLAQRLQALNANNNHNTHKPEVHFVKYRTQDDALRAQQAIQAQYDALGGTSHSTNVGVAPLLDFTTSAAGNAGGSGTYLPAAARLKK